jgi:hypothetical protein
MRDEFKQARAAVAAISVHDFGWVNRHEFWSRVIGSLIGAFLLTGDRLFIEKAVDFAEPLLAFQSIPFPTFVCMNCDDPVGNSSGFGTCLADCSAGLPEIAALYNLTKRIKYLSAFKFMLSQLPRPILGTYCDFYRTNKIPVGKHRHMNGHQVGFFVNVGLAGRILPSPQVDEVLARMNITDTDVVRHLYDLLIIYEELPKIPQFATRPVAAFVASIEQDCFETYVDDPRNVRELRSFEAQAIVPLMLWKIAGGFDSTGKIRTKLDAILAGLKDGQLYSGLRVSSIGRVSKDGILHSRSFLT